MKTKFDIEQTIKKGNIDNELEYERALVAERKIRVLSKDDLHFKKMRKNLRGIIASYEQTKWSDANDINIERIAESDQAEQFVEHENNFIETRKELIRRELKRVNALQQDLGKILGHKSKTYMSELMNGISPFSQKDLVIINRLLHIDFKYLIPVFLTTGEVAEIKEAINELNNIHLHFSEDDRAFR